jgi:serine/threonine protein kinase
VSDEAVECQRCGSLMRLSAACPGCGQRHPSSRLGSVLAGRYRLDAVRGQGGFGVVYQGTHLGLGGKIAVKFLLSELAVEAHVRLRFQREAQVLTRLRHPGIVTVLDFGEDAGDPYLVMELVEGRELRAQMHEALIPPSRVVSILTQVLEVLEAAHAAGIVHRDLKPDNIMTLDAGDGIERVKVLDFGLAFDAASSNQVRLTQTQTVNGTPLYMSPEQCRGRETGDKTDIYALGVLLYEMLAGEPPFRADDVAALLAMQMFVEPPRMIDRGFKRAPPPALEEVARWALSKRPEARPTAHQLREALIDAGRGSDPVTAAKKAAIERAAVGAMSRGERALRMPDRRDDELTQPDAPTSMRPITPSGPRVILWGFPEARVDALRSILAVNGIAVHPWSSDDVPDATVIDARAKACILHWDQRTGDRLQRWSASGPKLPVLVAEVGNAGAMPELVRLGASDATTSDVGDDVICKKTMRLVRRGR